jgi:precorrin-6B C5,15-methyltransferase / cobalt-precorrin-6B C5,C15-methyltransferase
MARAQGMTSVRRWLAIIGIGEDGLNGISHAARALIAQAALVVGGRRHLSLAHQAIVGETMCWPSPPQAAFPSILARRNSAVCVLATGDPFFYGIGSMLAQHVPLDEMICLPGLSSFSLAANRLGWALQDCATVSLHGRELEKVIPFLQPESCVLALSWNQETPRKLAKLLVDRGIGDTEIAVCEALGGKSERIRHTRADTFAFDNIHPLNLVAIRTTTSARVRSLPLTAGCPDSWFEHDGQLTKRDIRAITLATLAPHKGELLWDLGAGSGSISIEWMLAAPTNQAIAVERDQVRAERIIRNAFSFGVPNLKVIVGDTFMSLKELPPPNAIFIGGGATSKVIDGAWAALTRCGRLVVNSVSIETQAELYRCFKLLGGELKTIQVSHADPVGGLHAMRPSFPVTMWSAVKA